MFRYSPRRWLLTMVVTLLCAVPVVAVLSALQHKRWWELVLLYGPMIVVVGIMSRRVRRRQPRLPLRLTDTALEVATPDGGTLVIDYANIARARVHGWAEPRLTVEPVDPQLARPPLRANHWFGRGRNKPYDVIVPLDWMTPGRTVLRRELDRRISVGIPTP
ncbi:hypothetical protein GA0070564_1011247 [Micromonospora mirobrigensis]|uniref:PH domain-containing protein n=1 Tax=Micromonospora mirobrigensis TaxID=262898 RepID=A0A1C4VJ48_9ACTN|nr:hypothetical protein GA0070564_1011247 [Micromonospora mirobrigensis]